MKYQINRYQNPENNWPEWYRQQQSGENNLIDQRMNPAAFIRPQEQESGAQTNAGGESPALQLTGMELSSGMKEEDQTTTGMQLTGSESGEMPGAESTESTASALAAPPPGLTITTDAINLGDCGEVSWKARFDLDKPAPEGGIITQHITKVMHVEECTDPGCPGTVKDKGNTGDFWETWRVDPGKKTPNFGQRTNLGLKRRKKKRSTPSWHDMYQNRKQYPVCSKGYWDVQGEVYFIEGVRRPWPRFRKRGFGGGDLPSAKDIPKKWKNEINSTAADRKASGPFHHNLRISWDCCTGVNNTVLVSHVP